MRRFVIYISLFLILTASLPTPKNTKSIPAEKKLQTIALHYHKNLYFIKVKINNRNANLLVDTGAAASLLDINQANEFNFEFNKTDQMFVGVGGLSNRYRLTKYKIDHDTTTLRMYPYGADLKSISTSFMESGLSIAGVVGSDFFRTNDAIIDYKKRELVIYH